MTTTFMNNFLDEMCGGLAAISSVDNYAELERKAKELATEEYVKNKDNADFARICNYIMERYDMHIDELIEVLSAPYMLKLAMETKSKSLIEFQRQQLLDYRGWFAKKRDADEVAAYNFFNEKLLG